MFLRRHIDPILRWQYSDKKYPKILWDALVERFSNVHETVLPELTAKWEDMRLLDYKSVEEYDRDMLCLLWRTKERGRSHPENVANVPQACQHSDAAIQSRVQGESYHYVQYPYDSVFD